MMRQPTGKILVVDDTPANRYALVRILKTGGHGILEADTGQGGLDAAVSEQPDLILLDVKLPDIIGFEVTRRLKEDPATSHIPVLQISSSYTDADARAYGLNAGADAYLTSPMAPQVLLATVTALLRLRRAEQELKEAVQARDEFLAIASHDLRTPLMALQLKVEMMRRAAERGLSNPDALPQQLDGISQLVRRMISLLEGLLDISQINAGTPSLKLDDVDLSALAHEVLDRFVEQLGQSGSALNISIPDEPVIGRWDPMRVEQVIANLLSNAVKYGAGKPVDLIVEADAGAARIIVRDRGIGIAPDKREQIFQRFQRADADRESGSYGLGLWIVHELVQLLGGQISLDSAVGEGSTFTVELPLAGPQAAAEKAEATLLASPAD